MDTQTYTPTADDVFDVFAELPRVVQGAIISHLHSLRSRGTVYFSDTGYVDARYGRAVAEVIRDSGLLSVEFRDGGGTRFRANALTDVLRSDMRRVFIMIGMG